MSQLSAHLCCGPFRVEARRATPSRRHEDLHRVVAVAVGALVERALDTDWRAARRDGARKETAAKLDAEEWARSGRRLSRRRFGGGYSSIATQWVFDSAGLRQIRALDGNRGEQASRCDGTDAA
jgi:hypothetical protein